MLPSPSQLQAWNTSALAGGAAVLDNVVEQFDEQLNSITRSMDTVQDHWQGVGATAAARADTNTIQANHTAAATLAVVDVLNQGAASLAGTPEQGADLLISYWESRGWRTTKSINSGILIAGVSIPDGYGFGLQSNDKGGLAITGGSPCFPQPVYNDDHLAPQSVPHP